MIELRQVSKSMPSGGRPLAILQPLDLSVPAGQFVAVMGPSGSGKSTLLGLIAGLDTPSAGTINVGGQELTRLNEDALARFRSRTVGFVFQTFQLIPTLTALENVMVPLEIAGASDPRGKAVRLLEQVGLTGRATHYPAQLSGGEQQRVAVARAFACEPAVLLADEPTGNLDSANGEQVLDLLTRLHQERGITIVLVTHDHDVAARAQRVIQLRDGRIVADDLNGRRRTSTSTAS
jgi:putative ABC transport system ATP-binding protein